MRCRHEGSFDFSIETMRAGGGIGRAWDREESDDSPFMTRGI